MKVFKLCIPKISFKNMNKGESRIFKWGVKILKKKSKNQLLFQYLRDKKKKKKEGGLRKKGGGVKIYPFHLPWIRA